METKVREYAVGFNSIAHGRARFTTGASSPMAAVAQILASEGAPASVVEYVRERPICEYCDQYPRYQVKDSNEPVCTACAKSQTSGPLREYVRPLAVSAWPLVSWKRESMEITVRVRVDMDPDSWDTAYGTNNDTRSRDFAVWLDNSQRWRAGLTNKKG